MILVTGASGFVGRHLVRRLVKEGRTVRALVRADSDRSVLPQSQVEFAVGDIGDAPSLLAAADGCDTVIHLVGIIVQVGPATYERIHVEGTRNVVQTVKQKGVQRMLYLSGLGTRSNAVAGYHQTKWAAEETVRNSDLKWTVVRAAVIFGEGDGFTKTMLKLLKRGPFIPVVGDGRALLQPIFIDDLTSVLAWCLDHEESVGQTCEVAGPQQLTLEQVVDTIARVRGVRKRKLHVPIPIMQLVARAQESFMRVPEITRDQLMMMQETHVISTDVLIQDFGIQPHTLEEGLRTFLS